MLIYYVAFLIIIMALTWNAKQVVWPFCLTWLLTCVPIATGIIEFPYLHDYDYSLTIFLISNSAAFFAGIFIYRMSPTKFMAYGTPESRVQVLTNPSPMLVTTLWFIGVFGALMVGVDFLLSGGAAASGLAELRDNVTNKDSATIFGQIGSVLIWPLLYTYFYALVNQTNLTSGRYYFLVSSALFYAVPAVVSAGRQAALHLIIMTGAALLIKFGKRNDKASLSRNALVATVIVGGGLAYMLFIAVSRVEIWTVNTKEDVLIALFKFRISNTMDWILSFLPIGLRSSIVEGILYFSHTPALLDNILQQDGGLRFYGANLQPFLFRRVQPIVGIDPAEAYAYKVALLDSVGLVGVGWSTAYSGLLLDFGRYSILALMFFLGLFSQAVNAIAKRTDDFDTHFLYAVLLISIIYLPTVIAISDIGIFLATLFAIFRVFILKSRGGEVSHVAPQTKKP